MAAAAVRASGARLEVGVQHDTRRVSTGCSERVVCACTRSAISAAQSSGAGTTRACRLQCLAHRDHHDIARHGREQGFHSGSRSRRSTEGSCRRTSGSRFSPPGFTPVVSETTESFFSSLISGTVKPARASSLATPFTFRIPGTSTKYLPAGLKAGSTRSTSLSNNAGR
jgi:hypothetical protein